MVPLNVRTARLGVAAIAAITWLLTAAAATAGEPPALHQPVVPPGHEELLSVMLGRGVWLPAGCTFSGGGADGPLIRSLYTCPSGTVVLELVHASNARPQATQTERFAITLQSGTPPVELVDAVAERIIDHEADFEWVWLTSGVADTTGGESGELD